MTIIEQENKFSSGVYAKRDVAIVRGEGARIWDVDGRSYIDCAAGIGVASVGHSHPAVVQAITQQAQQLITCQEMFYNDRRAQLLQRLANVLPPGLNRFFLCNSGAEAVEGAIKFARLSTGKPDVVAAQRAFHGRTLGALSATHKNRYRDPFLPLVPGFGHAPFGQIQPLADAVTGQTAAVILEIVQGEGGVRLGTADYFQAVQELCQQRDVLLIVDEVQTGFGRTGRWFAFEHMDIQPDLVCMGKAMAGGVPMGAVALGRRVAPLPPGVHGSTFGGNPLACAAALATLRVIEEESLIVRAADLGDYLLERLQAIESPLVRDVRGLGLMIGIDLKVRVMPLVKALAQRGVQVLTAGSTVMRLLPPLVISRQEADDVVAAITKVLRTVG
ncbi:MAG: acetylornithine/succinylornithine family transaminase [Chloroflexi bacterium]|jgi:acetylornithine/LysW-gamma-L-lysine aminotransferase|nr:acetylornithine/succinylornithine family transaminase [Chloroflexota bacterium]